MLGAYSCQASDLSGELTNEYTAFYNGESFPVPQIAFSDSSERVLGITDQNKWIEVDLSDQMLRAWEGDSLYLETKVSTGLPWWPTPKGEFWVGYKIQAQKMEGGQGKYYYYLPNVPFVMFFGNDKMPWWKGYGLHGAYWHNDFGTRRSHGCVNLPIPVAEKLYYWAGPVVPEGKRFARADAANPGTRVVIHE